MRKVVISLQLIFLVFPIFCFINISVFADESSEVAIVWDKSGSMFRVRGEERMKPYDLERLNQYVVSALTQGTVEIPADSKDIDSVEQNKLNGPIINPGSSVSVIDFGLNISVRHRQVIIRDASHLMSLLPPTDKRKETYFEQDTYYRKAFVEAHDLVSAGLKPRKYLVTISDETESYVGKDPKVEDNFIRMERGTDLVFFMVVNRIVNFKIYDLSPSFTPTPSPVPTVTPTPTHSPSPTPTHTHSPVPTHTPSPLPTGTPTPTHTPTPIVIPTDTPLPIASIRLLGENNRDVMRITFGKEGKGRDAVVISQRKFRWDVPDGITAYPEETICTFANEDPVDVLFEENGYFRVRAFRNAFNKHKGQALLLKLPFINQSGNKDFHEKELANSVEINVLSLFFRLLVIVILLGGATFLVIYLLAPKEATITIRRSPWSNDPLKVVLNHLTPETSIPMHGSEASSSTSPYKLSFDGNVVQFIDTQKGINRELPTNVGYEYAFNDQAGNTLTFDFMIQIRKKWPWFSNG